MRVDENSSGLFKPASMRIILIGLVLIVTKLGVASEDKPRDIRHYHLFVAPDSAAKRLFLIATITIDNPK